MNKSGKSFFEFDEVEYFHKDITEDDTYLLMSNEKKNAYEQNLFDVLIGDFPNSISDSKISLRIKNAGYAKKKLDKSKLKSLEEIFIEKEVDEAIFSACINVYRDVLIFKRKKRVVGVAKICFDCMAYHIVGTNANTENFGQGGDYEKLATILMSK